MSEKKKITDQEFLDIFLSKQNHLKNFIIKQTIQQRI